MDGKIIDTKRICVNKGLCERYKELWDKADTMDDLMRLATDANGAFLLADMVAFEWGLNAHYIREKASDYLADKRVIEHNGYESCLYAADENLDDGIHAALNIVLDCMGDLWVPPFVVCSIVIATDLPLHIRCDGKAYITIYGDDASKITLDGDCIIDKHIAESEWRR